MESMNRITKKTLFENNSVYVVNYYESEYDYNKQDNRRGCFVIANDPLDAMQKLRSYISEKLYIDSIESMKSKLYHEANVVDSYHYIVSVKVKGSSTDPEWKVLIPYNSNPDISQLSSDIKDMLSQFQRNVTSIEFKIGDIKSKHMVVFKVITK